jgi:hypothetical protein
MILPGSWAGVLDLFLPVFKRRGTFVVFTVRGDRDGRLDRAALGGRGRLAGARMAQQISFRCGVSVLLLGGVGHRPGGG